MIKNSNRQTRFIIIKVVGLLIALIFGFTMSPMISGSIHEIIPVGDAVTNGFGYTLLGEAASDWAGNYIATIGDINQDKEITTMDYEVWYNSVLQGESGYKTTDINMDGEVTTMDYELWYNNILVGASSEVP